MSEKLAGFMDFVREQGVVGLAVGLTVGAAVTAFVNSIVNNLVNPIIGWILPGHGSLSSHYVCLESQNGACVNKMSVGSVIASFLNFMAIAAVVYFVVKGLGLDKIDKKKEAK